MKCISRIYMIDVYIINMGILNWVIQFLTKSDFDIGANSLFKIIVADMNRI